MIAAVNLIGGVTGFIWVVALIWALDLFDLSETAGDDTLASEAVQKFNARDKPAQLSDLKSLFDAGGITREQYEKVKAEIIR